jgi:hypothetical protein
MSRLSTLLFASVFAMSLGVAGMAAAQTCEPACGEGETCTCVCKGTQTSCGSPDAPPDCDCSCECKD